MFVYVSSLCCLDTPGLSAPVRLEKLHTDRASDTGAELFRAS